MFCEGMKSSSNQSLLGAYILCEGTEGFIKTAVMGGAVIAIGGLALSCLGCCSRRQNETPIVKNVKRSCIACGCCAATAGVALIGIGIATAATALVAVGKMVYSKY